MNGLLILDKPAGMTSHDVVAIVRRATGERSVGHLGTLDPMATGVLPLLLGKYTRLAQFFGAAEKSYTGTIRFGWATDTFDAEGERAGEAVELGLGLEELRVLAGRFHGEMEQMPPVYSAKKIGGVPAHKLARAGKEVAGEGGADYDSGVCADGAGGGYGGVCDAGVGGRVCAVGGA